MADTENGEQESFNVESTVDTIGVPGNDESVDDPVSVFSVSLSRLLLALLHFSIISRAFCTVFDVVTHAWRCCAPVGSF